MIIDFLSSNISFWPLVAFTCLVLAGFNVPISEDAIIIASAGICQDNPKMILPTIIFVYSGIIASDIIAYFFGYFCSKGFKTFRFAKRVLESRKKDVILRRLENNGFMTFFSFRFIPFGVRNILFLSSGFFRFNFIKFVIFDCISAAASSQLLFWLVYCIGSDASIISKAVSGVLLVVLVCFIIYNIRQIKKELLLDVNEHKVEDSGNQGESEISES